MTIDELRAWFAENYPHKNWRNLCAGVAWNTTRATTGREGPTYLTATAARRASVIVDTDPATAPAGAFHYWSYVTTLGGHRQDYGHVALALGDGLCLMSDAGTNNWPGDNIGITHVAAWSALRWPRLTYLGWARTYGANVAEITAPGSSGKGGESTPTPVERKRPRMNIPPLFTTADPADTRIFAIAPDGTKRHVKPKEMEVYKKLATQRGEDINDYIATVSGTDAIPYPSA